MSNCDFVAAGSLIHLAASRLALRAPALRAATALTRPNGSAQWLPCGRQGVPTAETVGPNHVVANHCVKRCDHLKPQNEIEAALALQMACTHTAAVSVLARFRGGGGSERLVVALASAAARLLRAYSGQVEALRRLRHGGDQYVRVEHVHINDGGQAVIGNVRPKADDRRPQAGDRALLRSENAGSQDQQPYDGRFETNRKRGSAADE
jgi:hypothetical protein